MKSFYEKDGLEQTVEETEFNAEAPENENIPHYRSRGKSMASIFSKFSTVSFSTNFVGYRFLFFMVSFLTIFMSGMTVGALAVRLLYCVAENNIFLPKVPANQSLMENWTLFH